MDCSRCSSPCNPDPNISTVKGKGGSLWLINTRTCNFACPACWQGDHAWTWQKESGLVKFMPDNVLAASLEFCKVWAMPDRFTLTWYGGEPLLQWDAIKRWTPVFKQALGVDGRVVTVSITTNGSLLDADKMAFLDQEQVGILLSLDGPPHMHNRSRILAGGGPSWDTIPVEEIAKWRPEVELAWTIHPAHPPVPSDLDALLDIGFSRINFNINWLLPWPPEQCEKLRDFIYYAVRLAIQSKQGKTTRNFKTNWLEQRGHALVRGGGTRLEKPCGTGLGMLAVTPEGYLYPSQEMAFKVFEPDRAPGTAEFYRVGNVLSDPVVDYAKLPQIMDLRTDQMVPPEGYSCEPCPYRSMCLGSCHCRVVGYDGVDPSNRMKVEPGWCPSLLALGDAVARAMLREGYLILREDSADKSLPSRTDAVAHRQLSIVDLDAKLDRVLAKLGE